MRRGSLKRRLFMVVMLTVVTAFMVHVVIQVLIDLRSATVRTTASTQDVAAAAIPLLKSALIVGDLSTAQETLDSIMGHDQFQSLRLLDSDERLILAGCKSAAPLGGEYAPDWFAGGLDFHFATQRFTIESGGLHYGTLVAEPSSRYLVADIWRRLRVAVMLWLATLAASLLLLRFTLRWGLQPLEDLTRAAHGIGGGDLERRAPVGNVPELAETARAFNLMADNLAEARERQEERIRNAIQELDSLITRIPAGVFKLRITAQGETRFDYVSPRWCELMEITAEEAYRAPQSALSRMEPEDENRFVNLFESARERRTPFQWEGRLREGYRVRWMRIEASPVAQDNGDILWEGIQYDISADKEREKSLDHIAHYDALTGLPNRVLLADRLQQAIAHAQRTQESLAVCYLDLDGFKPINDTLGHEAGDALLVHIAHRLHDILRGSDTVARIGGDEFVLLLSGLDHMDESDQFLRRILETLNAPVAIGLSQASVSASVGIALYPKDGQDPDMLLRHADQAMYQAKQTGRNRYVFFDPNLEDAARKHREQLQRIERGIATQEFELHYQPKVNMRLGQVVGFEVLVRWRLPDQGLLAPQDFLPSIEDNDLIVVLGEWVLESCLKQLADWQRQGLTYTLSVNIAPRQLQQAGFMDRLRHLLAVHPDAPSDRLEIEIVETSALADTARTADLINECQQLGVRFALDDFGAGYSSLTYLKSLPAQTLKIDQSFVRDMLTDANDLAIVEGVIGLTEIFRRNVVAEGVETAEHCTLLLNMGCDVAQGYVIARPMPREERDHWLHTWKPDPAWSAQISQRWPRQDLPLVIAASHHRAWIEQLVAFVEDPCATPPEPDANQCRFGQWHAGWGLRHYSRFPAYTGIRTVHEGVHALGQELIQLCNAGQRAQARARLPELLALRDELLILLQGLLTACSDAL